MAQPAVAQEAVRALRREIARIEGRLPPGPPAGEGAPPSGLEERTAAAPSGAAGFEAAIGGLPAGGLVEIATAQARDAGAGCGFALALAALCGGRREPGRSPPLLWIGTSDTWREIGLPCLGGLSGFLGPACPPLLLARTAHFKDALWAAEEAMGAGALGAVLLEASGNPHAPDLLATRRLHRRALAQGRLLFLLRHGAAEPEPTAAPLRLLVAGARARTPLVLGAPLQGAIGPPSFAVAVSKSRTGRPLSFTLDWNADEQRFTERAAADHGALVSPPRDRPDPAQAAGAVLAFRPAA